MITTKNHRSRLLSTLSSYWSEQKEALTQGLQLTRRLFMKFGPVTYFHGNIFFKKTYLQPDVGGVMLAPCCQTDQSPTFAIQTNLALHLKLSFVGQL